MRSASRMYLLLCLFGMSANPEVTIGDDDPAGTESQSSRAMPILRAAYQRGGTARGFSVRWMGQDGQDYVGPSNRLEPSEVQDVHLALGGLNPARAVVSIDVLAQGGDQWQYKEQPSSWKAELRRTRGATTADLYLEPSRAETGRVFHITLRYDDGSTVEADVRSRRTDPDLRMPGTALQAQWVGQGDNDRVGPGPSVGPDGIPDVRIRLSKLSVKAPIRSIRIDSPSGSHWEFGPNPQLFSNAELIRDVKDPSRGDLFLQPEQDLTGQRLKITVFYANEKRDVATVTGGRFASNAPCDPGTATEDRGTVAEREMAGPGRGQPFADGRRSRRPERAFRNRQAGRRRAHRIGSRILGLSRKRAASRSPPTRWPRPWKSGLGPIAPRWTCSSPLAATPGRRRLAYD